MRFRSVRTRMNASPHTGKLRSGQRLVKLHDTTQVVRGLTEQPTPLPMRRNGTTNERPKSGSKRPYPHQKSGDAASSEITSNDLQSKDPADKPTFLQRHEIRNDDVRDGQDATAAHALNGWDHNVSVLRPLHWHAKVCDSLRPPINHGTLCADPQSALPSANRTRARSMEGRRPKI